MQPSGDASYDMVWYVRNLRRRPAGKVSIGTQIALAVIDSTEWGDSHGLDQGVRIEVLEEVVCGHTADWLASAEDPPSPCWLVRPRPRPRPPSRTTASGSRFTCLSYQSRPWPKHEMFSVLFSVLCASTLYEYSVLSLSSVLCTGSVLCTLSSVWNARHSLVPNTWPCQFRPFFHVQVLLLYVTTECIQSLIALLSSSPGPICLEAKRMTHLLFYSILPHLNRSSTHRDNTHENITAPISVCIVAPQQLMPHHMSWRSQHMVNLLLCHLLLCLHLHKFLIKSQFDYQWTCVAVCEVSCSRLYRSIESCHERRRVDTPRANGQRWPHTDEEQSLGNYLPRYLR